MVRSGLAGDNNTGNTATATDSGVYDGETAEATDGQIDIQSPTPVGVESRRLPGGPARLHPKALSSQRDVSSLATAVGSRAKAFTTHRLV
jgi:hypothetical protein